MYYEESYPFVEPTKFLYEDEWKGIRKNAGKEPLTEVKAVVDNKICKISFPITLTLKEMMKYF
jgi:hypothetical protein